MVDLSLSLHGAQDGVPQVSLWHHASHVLRAIPIGTGPHMEGLGHPGGLQPSAKWLSLLAQGHQLGTFKLDLWCHPFPIAAHGNVFLPLTALPTDNHGLSFYGPQNNVRSLPKVRAM